MANSGAAGRVLHFFSQGMLMLGAGFVVAGAASAWANVTLLHNVLLTVPGVCFAGGGVCLAVALLVLLGGRRVPLLCIAAAVYVLMLTGQSARDIPRQVKHQVIGAQLALFPLNRLLDQFHIGDVQIADFSVPDENLLGPGLTWTMRGGWLLLCGGIIGLPADPAWQWIAARTVRVRCRDCGFRWLRGRNARFCPACGTGANTDSALACLRCGTVSVPGDMHCIACGALLSAGDKLPHIPQ